MHSRGLGALRKLRPVACRAILIDLVSEAIVEKQLKNIDDAYRWSLETVAALRAGKLEQIDVDELINEIGSIASGLKRELISVLREVIEGMLVIEYTDAEEGEKTRVDIRLTRAQGQVQLILDSAPSLSEILGDCADEAYADARSFVIEDYGVTLPESCPIPLDRILDFPYERVQENV